MKELITMTCPNCNGAGTTEQKHASWGTPACPEAYINVQCPDCNGSGEVEADHQ